MRVTGRGAPESVSPTHAGNRNFQLCDGLGRSLAVRRAEPEIRHIGDPALILVTPEHVDVVARNC